MTINRARKATFLDVHVDFLGRQVTSLTVQEQSVQMSQKKFLAKMIFCFCYFRGDNTCKDSYTTEVIPHLSNTHVTNYHSFTGILA